MSRAKELTELPPQDLKTYVEVGDVIEWFPGADDVMDAAPGVVTQVGLGTVTVSVFNPVMAQVIPQDGCRHMDDPKARQDNEGGGWRHRPLTVAVRKLFADQGVLVWNPATARYDLNHKVFASAPMPRLPEKKPTAAAV